MIIAVEGGDQAGKKTQTMMLAKALRSVKIKTAVFNFPDYRTTIGKEINSYLHGKRKFSPEIIHYLYALNRWEKLDEIKKSAAKNSILIMNRYYHSNLVYGMANGLDKKWLQNLDAELPRTDLVILLIFHRMNHLHARNQKGTDSKKIRNFQKKFLRDIVSWQKPTDGKL